MRLRRAFIFLSQAGLLRTGTPDARYQSIVMPRERTWCVSVLIDRSAVSIYARVRVGEKNVQKTTNGETSWRMCGLNLALVGRAHRCVSGGDAQSIIDDERRDTAAIEQRLAEALKNKESGTNPRPLNRAEP